MTLMSWKCPWSWRIRSWRRICWQAWNYNRNEVLRVALYSNPVLNEMWFLTIDPFIRISVFIAKLSKRQNCWRVFEDLHCQEYTQFFDMNFGLFMRLHFSIGGYDYRRTARFRQSIHFIIAQVLFADHMHRRAGVDNKFSFLRFKIRCRQAPFFRRWEECCSFMLLRSCHSVSSWDRSSNFGALGLRWWGSPGQISERRILVSNFSVTRNSLSWISHVGLASACLCPSGE